MTPDTYVLSIKIGKDIEYSGYFIKKLAKGTVFIFERTVPWYNKAIPSKGIESKKGCHLHKKDDIPFKLFDC